MSRVADEAWEEIISVSWRAVGVKAPLGRIAWKFLVKVAQVKSVFLWSPDSDAIVDVIKSVDDFQAHPRHNDDIVDVSLYRSEKKMKRDAWGLRMKEDKPVSVPWW